MGRTQRAGVKYEAPMTLNDRLAQLRGVLYQSASEDAWKEVCDFVSSFPPEEINVALAYAQEFLSRWPVQFREIVPMWEYKIISVQPWRQEIEDTLNLLGAQRWELVSQERYEGKEGDSYFWLYLKRRKIPGQEEDDDEEVFPEAKENRKDDETEP